MESEEEWPALTIDETARSSQSSDARGDDDDDDDVLPSSSAEVTAKPVDANDDAFLPDNISSSKDADTREQDFQLLRRHENGKDKVSPFVSSELDEFLVNLNKQKAKNSDLLRSVSDRSRSDSASDHASTLKSRLLSAATAQSAVPNDSQAIGVTNGVNSTGVINGAPAISTANGSHVRNTTTSSSTETSAPNLARKRHANLPAVIQKYMRMSKKTAGVDDSPEAPLESQSSSIPVKPAAKKVAPARKESKPSAKRATKRGRIQRPSSPLPVEILPSRSPSPTSCAASEENDSECSSSARTASPYHTNWKSRSTENLSSHSSSLALKATPSSEELRDRRNRSPSRASPAKSYVFKSLLHSHDVGAHGDLVFVRRPFNESSSSPSKFAAKLFHIHSDQAGWKAEKQNIVGTIMRIEHRLKSVQSSVCFQQRNWNVDVKLYDSSKEKPIRVKFPLRTLPCGVGEAGEGDEDVDVDVIFVKIGAVVNLVEDNKEVVDLSSDETDGRVGSMEGIAIVETKSLSQSSRQSDHRETETARKGDVW